MYLYVNCSIIGEFMIKSFMELQLIKKDINYYKLRLLINFE
jgi:hypothetical protein